MNGEITEPTVHLCWNESAIRRAAEVLRAAHLDIMAADVEAHLKPTIEEPEEFGSIVRAYCPGQQTEAFLWQKTPMHGKHYWESETGAVEVWPELTDVEVLRVGLGDDEGNTFSKGWDAALRELRKYVIQISSSAVTAERKDAYKNALDRIAALLEAS